MRIAPYVVALALVAGGWLLAVRPAEERTGAPPAAATAAPQTVFVFGGRGFGHGVGLPQYGARGAAHAGWDARKILAYYYPGTAVEPEPAHEVRVLVGQGRPSLAASHDGPWRAVPEGGAAPIALTAGAGYRLSPSGGEIVIGDAAGREVARVSGPVVLEATGPSGAIALNGTVYRGRVRVVPTTAGLDAVNLVDLEDYLLGVVPKEMPAAWADDAPAAVQAQAIAARTYALANLAPDREWDLYDDQRSQVYGGRTAEDPRTSAAVRATAGEVATYQGRPIAAFFMASSGGHTEAGVNVFGTSADVPYLAGVVDPFDDSSPYHRWSAPIAVTARRLAGVLGMTGQVAAVDVLRRGVSPRVLEARVTTAWPFYARRDVAGTTLRADLGLPDTWFSVATRTVDAAGRAVPVPAGAGRDGVWLAVLNGSTTQGLASRVAERAEQVGYRAVTAANAPAQTTPTTAYFRPGAQPAAARVAKDLGVSRVAPLPSDPALATQAPTGAQVVVVLGP